MTKELFDSPQSQTQANIRDLLIEMGRASVSDIARVAISRGLIDDETLNQCQMRGASELIRKALKATLPTGLPFAKPLSDGDGDAAEWAQLEMFTYDEFAALIIREATALESDYAKVLRLRDACLQRFGRAPEIPEMRSIEIAQETNVLP